jgi:hypothetical protein
VRARNVFGQIRTLELRNSARIVQKAAFRLSAVKHADYRRFSVEIALICEMLKSASTLVRAGFLFDPVPNPKKQAANRKREKFFVGKSIEVRLLPYTLLLARID